MDSTQFYCLDEEGLLNAVCVDFAEDFNSWDVLRGNSLLPEGALCYPYMGKKFYDIIIPSRPFPFLISDKVVDAFTRNSITGWKATPVRIAGKEDLKYYVLMVTGRCGFVDRNKSVRIIKKSPGGKDWPFLQGLFFEPESWDGTDMFVAENVSFIFCTEKVKKVIKQIKATNISFENSMGITIDAFTCPSDVLSCLTEKEADKWSDLVRTIKAQVDEELKLQGFANGKILNNNGN